MALKKSIIFPAAVLTSSLLFGSVSFAGTEKIVSHALHGLSDIISVLTDSSDGSAGEESSWKGLNEEAANGTYNLLLIGVDRRSGEDWNGNSDVMILATVNEDRRTIYLTSFMRDLYADIPGVGISKLNAACANGGPALTAETIQKNYGVNIDDYILVDFESMADIVDAFGGIEITISDDEMNVANGYIQTMCEEEGIDPEEHLIKNSGTITMDGIMAVAYCRDRFSTSGSDFDRTARQRTVLYALLSKVRDGSVSPAGLTAACAEILPSVSTSLSLTDMINLAADAVGWKDYSLEQNRVPFDGEYTSENEILVPTDMDTVTEKIRSLIY